VAVFESRGRIIFQIRMIWKENKERERGKETQGRGMRNLPEDSRHGAWRCSRVVEG
jgi:hypothetical protein